MTSPTAAAPPRPQLLLGALAAVLLALLVSGCTAVDSSDSAVVVPTPSVPVLQPGRPGEPNATVTGSAAAPTATAATIPTDVRFYSEMIVHHAQALVMARSVLPHLTDPQVRALASRMADEQEPEIASMAAWLQSKGEDVPPEATNPNLTDHGSHSMPGMASEAEIGRLASATGVQADRLFLTLMTLHHRGALAMVDEQVHNPSDELVEETAAEIHVTQTKQIGQMQEMLDRLT